VGDIKQRILGVFTEMNAPAAFVCEIQAVMGVQDSAAVARGLAELVTCGDIIVVPHEAPDRHLGDIDLRIAACIDHAAKEPELTAIAHAETKWTLWLRDFFSSHRCS